MRTRLLLGAGIVAASGAVLCARAPMLATIEWDGSESADFNEPDNWTPAGVPGPTDTVVIPDVAGLWNAPVLNTNAAVRALAIEDGGALETSTYTIEINGASGLAIEAGGRLTVDRAGTVEISGGGTGHGIDGLLELRSAGSTFAVTNGATVSGAGTIRGLHNAAKIFMAPARQLRCSVIVEGGLVIDAPPDFPLSPGKFVNQNLVHANRGLSIELFDETIVGDVAGAVWKASRDEAVTLTGSTLRFSADGPLPFKGDFVVEDGARLEFEVTIRTTGRFQAGPGRNVIEVAAGSAFEVD